MPPRLTWFTYQFSPSLAQVKSAFQLCQALPDAQQFLELKSLPRTLSNPVYSHHWILGPQEICVGGKEGRKQDLEVTVSQRNK